jgi:pyruvate dehydrogenase E2 component (dihydrolipoamide acetyltransferase)
MHQSHLTNAPVTFTREADASQLVLLRQNFKTTPSAEITPSYAAIFAKLCASTLIKHPRLNASIKDEKIVYHQAVHIATAVDTERGLLVPVVRNVQDKTLLELTKEMAHLFQITLEGKANPDQLTGGTFTITNLGKQEIDFFTPIINPPQAAILGIGRIIKKVVPEDGKPVIRPMVALSLTFDHRIVDGGPAASFLQEVKRNIEKPYLWLA